MLWRVTDNDYRSVQWHAEFHVGPGRRQLRNNAGLVGGGRGSERKDNRNDVNLIWEIAQVSNTNHTTVLFSMGQYIHTAHHNTYHSTVTFYFSFPVVNTDLEQGVYRPATLYSQHESTLPPHSHRVYTSWRHCSLVVLPHTPRSDTLPGHKGRRRCRSLQCMACGCGWNRR
jgi:hypothetical protein